MSYVLILILIGMILGVVSVVSSPSPYFAALGLVVMAAAGCSVLVVSGGSFLSLVLFLIYLGGMLVVFAYSAALAAEPYPEAWGEWSVLGAVGGYLVVIMGAVIWFYNSLSEGEWLTSEDTDGKGVFGLDSEGVALMYSSGGGLLILSAWVLLLTLFVVLSVTWGRAEGSLRVV
uniref:NADH-ubiquinone oxidoreductase chain 6 n=1 Tax=Bregmaceros nectabanus TaxID=181412 RepID=Q8HM92_BRENE|nr:NADH dehydrogenase subunit 6 [Bregmaceros nectabanus]